VVGVRLADDRRGRVPFALVAVVLLVGAATFAATLRGRDPGGAEPAGPAVEQRLTGAVRTAVADATARGAARAARDPVLTPANTTYGRVLDPDRPFRDALRARVYLASRRALAAVEERVGSVRGTASLPPVSNASTFRRAIESVSLDRIEGGVRVRLQNVTTVVRRGERVLDRDRRTVAVTVATPALALHDRVERYEERLSRGPLAGPGLGRRLTARLYAAAWARGYAQYGGAPIENVVSNRHVELSTNGALLAEQRATLGRADRAGRAGLRRATARVALLDLVAPFDRRTDGWLRTVLGPRGSSVAGSGPVEPPTSTAPTPESTVPVEVNRTADAAFLDLVAGDGGPSLQTVVERTYAADVRLAARVVDRRDERRPAPTPPGPDWRLVDTDRDTRVTVRPTDEAPVPTGDSGWVRHAAVRRVVDRVHTSTRRWRRGNRTRTTTARWRSVHAVGLAVLAWHAPSEYAPGRPFAVLHERGGPLDGQNLRGVPDRALDRLVDDRGGPATLARRAVDGDLDTSTRRLRGERPTDLYGWVYRDLVGLRERVRNVTVVVRRGDLGTAANPPEALARELRARRSALVDAPAEYRSVADKVRVAARAAYLDRVERLLRSRASETDRTSDGVGEALSEASLSVDRVRETMAARGAVERPTRASESAVDVVDADPAYLPLSAVEADRLPSVESDRFHALAARNQNVFTMPYQDAADTVLGAVFSEPNRVRLRTAALALRRTDRTLATPERWPTDAPDRETLRDRRADLGGAIRDSLRHLRRGLRPTLADHTSLSAGDRRRALEAALGRWASPTTRALAAANGSLTTAVVDETAARTDLSASERDLLDVRVRGRLVGLLEREDVRVEASLVGDAATTSREVTRRAVGKVASDVLERAVTNASERLRDRIDDRYGRDVVSVPAGMPVTPLPSHWYATLNVWRVTVDGRYARFAVRSNRGTPAGGGVRYVRDGSTVRVDVDGDGDPDRLGEATRLGFRTETTVLVVVPPGREGVGDRDGNADERSPGWPDAGPTGGSRQPLASGGGR
jgi:hypothetical protein